MAGRILVLGTQSSETEALCTSLAAKGHAVVPSDTSVLDVQRLGPRDVIVTTGPDAVETCDLLQRRDPKCAVVVLDGAPNMMRAIAALRAGAQDFVIDPTDVDAVDAAIRRVLEKRILGERLGRLGSLPEETDPSLREFLGESVAMRQVRARLHRLKGSDTNVLITGETGTGKKAAARILHDQSLRRERPFITVNPAAPLKFAENASGATLFFHEIERLSRAEQTALERALEQRIPAAAGQFDELPFDARIIAASKLDLANEVLAGRFSEALYSRLSVVEIRLPPLKERGLDALLLAQHFVRRFATASGKRVVGMTLGAARALMEYDWPGNVRELADWIEAAVAQTHHDHITETELLAHAGGAHRTRGRDDALVSWNSLEARHIASILEEAKGNKARAARLLGIDRKTLYRKLERYGLDTPERLRRAH